MFFFSFFVQARGSVFRASPSGVCYANGKRFEPPPTQNFYQDHLPLTIRVRSVAYGDVNGKKRPPIKKNLHS